MARKRKLSEGDVLFQEILAHPEDDAPRLIYADWLDEHGTKADAARAEFIRVQCALARLDKDDPRHGDLRERELDLLDKHGDRWRAKLPKLPGVRWVDFRRGFVAEAFLNNFKTFRTHGEAMFAAAPVEWVSLRGLTPRTARELAALPLLARVRCLVLVKSDMGDPGLQELSRSPYLANLAELQVGIGNVGPAGFAAVAAAGLPNLTSLDLDFQHMDDDGAQAFAAAANFPRLTTLSLRDNAIGDVGAQALADCPGLTGLVHLDLFGNPISDEGARALAQSRHLSRLKNLTLYENRITAAGAGALIDSSHLVSLTKLEIVANPIAEGRPDASPTGVPERARSLTLNLRGNRIDDATAAALAECPGLVRVARLDLGYNPFGDAGAAALAASSHLARLPALILDQTSVGCEGLEALANSPFLFSLNVLNLRRCRLGAEAGGPVPAPMVPPERTAETLDLGENDLAPPAVRRLAASPALARFRRLVLDRNRLDAAGVTALVGSPYLAGLQELDLSHNEIGPAGAEALAKSPALSGLQTLKLWGAAIGDDGLRALAESPHLAGLNSLVLGSNGIGNLGVQILVSAPHGEHLTELDLRHNNLSPKVRDALRDRFGDRVRWSE